MARRENEINAMVVAGVAPPQVEPKWAKPEGSPVRVEDKTYVEICRRLWAGDSAHSIIKDGLATHDGVTSVLAENWLALKDRMAAKRMARYHVIITRAMDRAEEAADNDHVDAWKGYSHGIGIMERATQELHNSTPVATLKAQEKRSPTAEDVLTTMVDFFSHRAREKATVIDAEEVQSEDFDESKSEA